MAFYPPVVGIWFCAHLVLLRQAHDKTLWLIAADIASDRPAIMGTLGPILEAFCSAVLGNVTVADTVEKNAGWRIVFGDFGQQTRALQNVVTVAPVE